MPKNFCNNLDIITKKAIIKSVTESVTAAQTTSMIEAAEAALMQEFYGFFIICKVLLIILDQTSLRNCKRHP